MSFFNNIGQCSKKPIRDEEGPDHRYRPAIWKCHGEDLSGKLDKIVDPWLVDENFEYLNMDECHYLQVVEDAFQGFDGDIVVVSAGLTPTSNTGAGC